MIPAPPARAQLADLPQEQRTTATLLASLEARLATLQVISAAAAAGSLIVGLAALGRQVVQTAEGARLKRALEAGRAGMNGNAIWSALGLDDWTSGLPPSPVYRQIQNDIALVAAEDLGEVLAAIRRPAPTVGVEEGEIGPATFLDYTLGLWALARTTVQGIEALAAPTMPLDNEVAVPAEARSGAEGGILR